MMRYGNEAKIRSAISVVTPDAKARSLYRSPSANSMSVSLRAMWVDDRWIIVTSAPFSHRAAQMSWALLFEPSTTAFLPV